MGINKEEYIQFRKEGKKHKTYLQSNKNRVKLKMLIIIFLQNNLQNYVHRIIVRIGST